MDPVAHARIAEYAVAPGRRPVVHRCLVLAFVLAACEAEPTPTVTTKPPSAVTATCDPGRVAATFAPGADAALERIESWPRTDEPILADAERLAAHRVHTATLAGGAGDPWRAGMDGDGVLADARRRCASFEDELRNGVVTEADAGAIADARGAIDRAQLVDHARLVVTQTQLHCAPTDSAVLRLPERDAAFDRNACTTLHPGELVRVHARADAGRWLLVDAGHTTGWVRPAGLSERIAESDRTAWRDAQRVWALRDDVKTNGGVPVRLGVGLPLVSRTETSITVRIGTASGPGEDTIDASAAVSVGFVPLRRAAVLEAAFAQIGAPYGWGGRAGARDCSQFLRDTLMPFGIELPRHSSVQALAGFTTIDVAGWTAADKLAEIDRASRTGLVLEYMPGHIMLDVGSKDGKRWSISAIAEFLVPCANGGDTVHRLDRVALTDLETGRGSARGAFIDRITTLAVFAAL